MRPPNPRPSGTRVVCFAPGMRLTDRKLLSMSLGDAEYCMEDALHFAEWPQWDRVWTAIESLREQIGRVAPISLTALSGTTGMVTVSSTLTTCSRS